MELVKIDEEERPFPIDARWSFGYASRIRASTPSGWRFRDNEIPRWFEAFKEKRRQELKDEVAFDVMEE